ncbi:MAG: hypothetical protein RL329_1949 [Bacteroidota bacterium]|jgi:hypothetical protein
MDVQYIVCHFNSISSFLVHDKKGKEGDGCTDFTDFHAIFTDFASSQLPIRENRVKIR